jgi:hypothetical protein
LEALLFPIARQLGIHDVHLAARRAARPPFAISICNFVTASRALMVAPTA